MKSLLLIGGTGFFGKSFINAFLKGRLNKWDVSKLLIASRNASAFVQHNPSCFNSDISYIDLDITKLCEIPSCDYVMHFANSSDKARYEKDLEKEILNIKNSMSAFVESVEKSSANPSHMLFASSGAVYSPQISQKYTEGDLIGNIDKTGSIRQNYAEAKLISEKTFRQLQKKGRRLSIARCFSFVGSELPLNKHFVAGNLIQNILNKKALEIKANIPVVRSYLHTDDLVFWLMEILLSGTNDGILFNVGSDDSSEIHDLAKELASHFCLPTEIAPFSSDNQDWYVPNIDKARSLGLRPSYSSIQAILKTVDELHNNSSRFGI